MCSIRMEKLRRRARLLGGVNLRRSTRKDKKYMLEYDGKTIHFGAAGMSDFTIHNDPDRRRAYRARHRKILTKEGRPAYKIRTQPAYWSWNLLW